MLHEGRNIKSFAKIIKVIMDLFISLDGEIKLQYLETKLGTYKFTYFITVLAEPAKFVLPQNQ